MPRYDIRVDGRSRAVVKDEAALRAWLRDYREKHRDDDPAAAHVQLLELRRVAWLRGGRLVAHDRFL
jgi:hypothetical protein